MMRKILFLLATLMISANSAFANHTNHMEIVKSKTDGVITFYNNTNIPVAFNESGVTGGLTTCQGSPFNWCVKPDPTTYVIQPNSSAQFTIKTAVKDQKIYDGGVLFHITTDGNSHNVVDIPVEANPYTAYITINFDSLGQSGGYGNSHINSYSETAMPQYVVSVAQVHTDDLAAKETAVSINKLN